MSHADTKENDCIEAMLQEERLQLLPEKFNDSGNFNDWVSNFVCISSINSWSKQEKAHWLGAHTTERARLAYQCLSHYTQETFI